MLFHKQAISLKYLGDGRGGIIIWGSIHNHRRRLKEKVIEWVCLGIYYYTQCDFMLRTPQYTARGYSVKC